MSSLKLKKLFKRGSDGAALFWEIEVRPLAGHSKASEDPPAEIVTRHGHIDGKVVETKEIITEGKNAGKRNATTASQQAIAEATAKHKAQLERKGYGHTLDASAAVRSTMPMLALAYEKVKDLKWTKARAQAKYDGHRCLATKGPDGKVHLRSRQNKPIETMPHVVEALAPLLANGETFDGELYLHGVPFQAVASAIKKKGELTEKIEYNVYDMVLPLSFADRFEELRKRFDGAKSLFGLKLVDTVKVTGEEDLMAAVADFLAAGYEGGMLRTAGVGYEAGKRSKSLIKVKEFEDAEFEVVDFREGRGTHAGMAIFVCGLPGGKAFDVTAPGTHDEKRSYWINRAAYLRRKLTVKFQGRSTDGVPRFPVALRFREETD